MMSKLIRRSLTTSSRMMVRAQVPVFSSSDRSQMMVTQPGTLEKANLMMFGTPNRAETGDYGLDISIEEWKAGALTGVGLVTKALAQRDWDLLGSGLVTSDCLARLRILEIRQEDRHLAQVKTENVFFSFITEDRLTGDGREGLTVVIFSLPVLAELVRLRTTFSKYQNETNRKIEEKKVKFERKRKSIQEARKSAVDKKDRIKWRDAVKNDHRIVDQINLEVQDMKVKERKKAEDANRDIFELLRKNNDVVIGNYRLCKVAESWIFSEISQTKASVAWNWIWRLKMDFVLRSSLKNNEENFQAVLRQNYIQGWLPFCKHLFMNRVYIKR